MPKIAGWLFFIWAKRWVLANIYQALPSQRRNPRLARIGWLFSMANLANAAWLFAWHDEQFPLSVVLMLSLLGLLIAIYLRLDIGRVRVSAREKWFVDVPLSIYLGWISVATIANISDLLYYWRWDGWSLAPELWTVVMLTAASAIALAMALTRGDAAFLLVIAWAFVGVAVKQAETSVVASTALVLAGAALLMIPLGFFYRRILTTGRTFVLSNR